MINYILIDDKIIPLLRKNKGNVGGDYRKISRIKTAYIVTGPFSNDYNVGTEKRTFFEGKKSAYIINVLLSTYYNVGSF